MLFTVPLVMMVAAAPAADAVGMGRKGYAQCINSQLQPALDQKMPLGDFQATLKKACADKEATFRSAIIAADKADGMSDKAAQADADDQVSEYVDKMTGEYEDYQRPS